jgi:WhiB family redox-sensing transcriptional regulator
MNHAPAGVALACKDVDPDIFYADDPTPAKAVCAHCPAPMACLDEAITTGQRGGVWGGLNPIERGFEAARRRRLSLAPAATVEQRRAQVAQLSQHLPDSRIAEVLGVSVDIVASDRKTLPYQQKRPRATDATGDEVFRLADAGTPRRVIAMQIGVSRRTVERWLRRRKNQQATTTEEIKEAA